MIMTQMMDMGLSRTTLESYLVNIGYWRTPELRRRNAYVLSPSAYAISSKQRTDLERLSVATYRAVRALSERLSALAQQRTLDNAEARFLALATGSRRGLPHPKEIRGAVPPIFKVDLMQDADGRYSIAEVDTYNPRGFGYMALLDGSVPDAYRTEPENMSRFSPYLAQKSDTWTILVSERERYYEPSFNILATYLKQYGIDTKLVRESSIDAVDFGHVLCIPESMHDNIVLREKMVQAWCTGQLQTLFPPAAYLGSKAFLPFLREQEGMQVFIPECALVSKRSDPLPTMNGSPLVLKGVMSSGLKQVVFSAGESLRFATEYSSARKTKNPLWLLQREVQQKAVPVTIFEDSGARMIRDYFLRITAYVSEKGLLGAEVTGRPDRAVHGAPDCIQVPAIQR